MLRYADAIVKRGVDKLIDAIAHNPEPQTKNAETPQPQKSMGNNTDCAPQTTGNTTNCGLTEQTITLMDELYNIRYNVLDRTPEVQRHDLADKGLVSVSKPYLRLLKNPTRDEAAEKCPTRDASPPLVLAFLQEPSATTKRYHQTLPLMGGDASRVGKIRRKDTNSIK